MALSDDLLDHPSKLSAVRREIDVLVDELDATAGFLIDEDGTPFATVGHVEFRMPHPLTNLRGGEALLRALVGEHESHGSLYVIERVGRRALLALLTEPPQSHGDRATRRRVREPARTIAAHQTPLPQYWATKNPKKLPNTTLPARWPRSACSVNAVVARHHSPARKALASARPASSQSVSNTCCAASTPTVSKTRT